MGNGAQQCAREPVARWGRSGAVAAVSGSHEPPFSFGASVEHQTPPPAAGVSGAGAGCVALEGRAAGATAQGSAAVRTFARVLQVRGIPGMSPRTAAFTSWAVHDGAHRMPGATCRRSGGGALSTTPQRPDGWRRSAATDDRAIDALRAPVPQPTCPDWLPRKDCSAFVVETGPCRTTPCRTSRCQGANPPAPCHPGSASNGRDDGRPNSRIGMFLSRTEREWRDELS